MLKMLRAFSLLDQNLFPDIKKLLPCIYKKSLYNSSFFIPVESEQIFTRERCHP